MKLPSMLNGPVTRAQIDHPVVAAKVIRRLTGSSGKKGTGATDATEEAVSSISSPAASPTTPTRTNGIEAAKLAAGIPAEH
ncbi:hypothetical protein ACT3SZ_02870 [Corynebacterium sp. AOP40-9SA-29]|uniref:hypothetical protein n=1 Tax=Corynebacterium sp. AOP40-9SA-29 TaxID=3457677 RepID=UPI0040334819